MEQLGFGPNNKEFSPFTAWSALRQNGNIGDNFYTRFYSGSARSYFFKIYNSDRIKIGEVEIIFRTGSTQRMRVVEDEMYDRLRFDDLQGQGYKRVRGTSVTYPAIAHEDGELAYV